MVLVCIRRQSDSQFSRAIQEAIQSICDQKQCPNEERIVKFVMREFDWKAAEISRQLRFAVQDGLLREITGVAHKGSKKGAEQTSYRANYVDLNGNTEVKPVETHDWYCFDCQESGEVILCDFCPRVFHRKCAKAHYISQDENWKCPSCKACEERNSTLGKSKDQINGMLKFTIERMKEKFTELTKPVSLEKNPDYSSYIFHPTDLSCIEMDIQKREFISPGQFLEEIKWMLHNAIIYFGDDDDLTVLAEELVEDTKQEIEEMLLCTDCYNLSNAKPEEWFCKPCNPPHEVVWAKMTGQPPWPAKVLKWNEDKTKGLVRFFEERHQRAWVYFRHISPISSKPDIKKRPRQWLDAQQELFLYQKQLRELYGDVKPKTELEQTDSGNEEQTSAESSSEESSKRLASVFCQTDEDPNKAVIDKLRKRIDDLEQDLKETKEKLNLQQTGMAVSHYVNAQGSGKILSYDTKDKVQKFIASLSEQLKKKIGKAEIEDEQMCAGVGKDGVATAAELECGYKLEELRKKLELERSREVEDMKMALEVKHNNEMTEVREKERAERQKLMAELMAKLAEEKSRETQEAKINAKRKYESELKMVLEASRLEREKVVTEMKRDQERLKESIGETKRKQWCCNCWQEACYPCCWNTSYCSRHCQVVHWQQHRLQCSRNFVCLGRPTRS